jgi:hypothetical protein
MYVCMFQFQTKFQTAGSAGLIVTSARSEVRCRFTKPPYCLTLLVYEKLLSQKFIFSIFEHLSVIHVNFRNVLSDAVIARNSEVQITQMALPIATQCSYQVTSRSVDWFESY